MRSYTLLFVAALVIGARAASIAAPAQFPAVIAADQLQKKFAEVIQEAIKDENPIENNQSEQELIEQVNGVSEINNNLRNKPVEVIPVKVVTEDGQTALKTSIDEGADISDVDIKRVKADVSNPGSPQRQEHDSQSPEDENEEQETVTSIKQTIADSQNVFQQGLQGVSTEFQNWFAKNEQISSIQASIQNLQQSFQNQITKLNATVHSFWKPEETSPPSEEPGSSDHSSGGTVLDNVEKGLDVIENNFEKGVKSMVSGVQGLSSAKSEESNTSSSSSNNQFLNFIQQFQETMQQNFANLTNNIQLLFNQNQQGSNSSNIVSGPSGFFENFGQGIQNIIGQQNGPNSNSGGKPEGAESDEQASSTTKPPTIWQGISSSFQNIWRPGQGQGQGSSSQENTSGPFAQAIQGVVNFIQPKPPATTVVEPESTSSSQEGSNVVPDSNEKPSGSSATGEKQKPEVAVPAPTAAPAGPLQQIVQRNPIMAGLAGAVQRIQHTINNPEKPRDQVKDEKAGYYPSQIHTPAQGDNNNGQLGVAGKSDPEVSDAVKAPPAQKECDKTPAEPAAPMEPQTDKTEVVA